MNVPRLTWKRVLLVLVLMPLAWLAYRTCPCALEMGDEGDRFRLTSLPNICAVLSITGVLGFAGVPKRISPAIH